MFYSQKAEISADPVRPKVRGEEKDNALRFDWYSNPRHWALKNIGLSFVLRINRARRDPLRKIKCPENDQRDVPV